MWGGIAIALTISGLIAINNDLHWCVEVLCFSNLLEIYDLPIKIMSTGMAIAAFVAVMHRSEQTNYQIELTNSQNVFKNFIDHRSEFLKILDTLAVDYKINFTHRSHLYLKLFPNNNFQNVEFVTTSSQKNKPRILDVINKYNKLIDDYNLLLEKCEIGSSVSTKELAQWMSEFLFLTMDMCVYPQNIKKANSDWHEPFYPILFEGIPEDLDSFIFAFENVLGEFSEFCFPNVDIEILINSRDHSDLINEIIMSFYTEEDKLA